MKWSEWMLFVPSEIKFKSFGFSRGQTVKTKIKTKTLPFKTKTKTKILPFKTKTKTIFLVLEGPRDQDQCVEDYSAAVQFM